MTPATPTTRAPIPPARAGLANGTVMGGSAFALTGDPSSSLIIALIGLLANTVGSTVRDQKHREEQEVMATGKAIPFWKLLLLNLGAALP